MHKSQLAGIIIDCQADDLDQAAAFWSAALGLKAAADPRADVSIYRHLETGPEEMHIDVQRVDHGSRVHLDIETDDIEAEVARLVASAASPDMLCKTPHQETNREIAPTCWGNPVLRRA